MNFSFGQPIYKIIHENNQNTADRFDLRIDLHFTGFWKKSGF